MFPILKKEEIASDVTLMEIAAPEIAKKAQAGQFIVLRIGKKGERIPLTIADYDKARGTVTIVFLKVGKTTQELGRLAKGDSILDLVGPLGKPTHIRKYGSVVCVGGGVGIAAIYPIARAFKETGNRTISVIGAKTADLLIFEPELAAVSDELHVTTDDGSKGHPGVVTKFLGSFLKKEKVDLVMAIGPAIMMKFVAETTRPLGIKTLVSLNPIMLDATGMCGTCRVEVGGETKFGCIDGPDFDGHQVNFDLLMVRQQMYLAEEKEARERYERLLKAKGRKQSAESGE